MWKEKLRSLTNMIIKHSKIVFPAVVVVAVAITVAVSLSLSNHHKEPENTTETESTGESVVAETTEDVPLVENSDGDIYTLIATYYNARALGDEDTIRSLCDEVSDKDMIRYAELAQYIDYYPALEIYTKVGPEEGAVIAFVYYKVVFTDHPEEVPGYQALYICTNADGNLYIKRGENSEEVNDYIKTVSTQDDVIEFNNKITVEYKDLMAEHPDLLQYVSELDSEVSAAVGVKLADQMNNSESQTAEGDSTGDAAENTGDGEAQTAEEQPAQEPTTQYATTTTTVNVRSSDSEQADKLGKASSGQKLEVLEQRPNGWTKVLFEGKEGYIKSEFLQTVDSAAGAETIGTVTATTNINVRASASESADRLGVLSGGDSAELIGTEGDWSKIKYNGQIGYVKSEYVQ